MRLFDFPAGRAGVLACAVLALAACGSVRETLPARAATEQLLISAAADRAAEALAETLPTDRSYFVDATNFEGNDGKYAIAAIRDGILRKGARIAADRDSADTVVEIRAGALSVDKSDSLIGIPSMQLPIPLTPNAQTPEIALYKNITAKGVAKFAATAYDPRTGQLVVATGPQFGVSHLTERTLLLFINWTTDDIQPDISEIERLRQVVIEGG
jgi:hypothetical protein